MWARERAPTPSLSAISPFGLAVESIKELGGASSFMWNWAKFTICDDVSINAFTMLMAIRFNGHHKSNELFWLVYYLNFKDYASWLLIGHLLKFGKLGIICPIKASLMGGKTCIQWIIQDHFWSPRDIHPYPHHISHVFPWHYHLATFQDLP